MITNNHNEKITARIKAQDIIMDKLSAVGYWVEDELETKGMTEREIKMVQEQIKKECDRIAKRFGFDESWSS
jgi:hypothetical protein